MRFKVHDVEDPQELFRQLSGDVKSTRTPVELGMGQHGWATWNEEGEPGSKGCITVGRLHKACDDASLLPQEDNTCKVLSAFMELVIPEDKEGQLPWHEQPLIRVVCPRMCATLEGNMLTVKGFVYLRRL
jgi:hypothetical protein